MLRADRGIIPRKWAQDLLDSYFNAQEKAMAELWPELWRRPHNAPWWRPTPASRVSILRGQLS
jgi:hypothetical protein